MAFTKDIVQFLRGLPFHEYNVYCRNHEGLHTLLHLRNYSQEQKVVVRSAASGLFLYDRFLRFVYWYDAAVVVVVVC